MHLAAIIRDTIARFVLRFTSILCVTLAGDRILWQEIARTDRRLAAPPEYPERSPADTVRTPCPAARASAPGHALAWCADAPCRAQIAMMQIIRA